MSILPMHPRHFADLPASAACCLVVGIVLIGCAPATPPAAPPAAGTAAHDHDHDHAHDHGAKEAAGDGHADHVHPETLAEGVAELEKLVVTVAEKLGSGAKDAADDAVHAAGHLLEDLDGLLEKQELAADVKTAGKKALAELYDCFDKLDVALHAAADAAESPADVHASLKERFEAAVKALKGLVVGKGSTTDEGAK